MAVFYTRARSLSNRMEPSRRNAAFKPMLLEDIKRGAERLTGLARPSPKEMQVPGGNRPLKAAWR